MRGRTLRFHSLLGALLLTMPSFACAQTPNAATPESFARWARHFHERVDRFQQENEVLAEFSTQRNIVLLGDSLTEGWEINNRISRLLPGLPVVNRGIVSDTVTAKDGRGLVNRMEVSVFDCNPSHVFLLMGVNDIGDLTRNGVPSVDTIFDAYRDVVEQIRSRTPGVVLVLTSCTPAGEKRPELSSHILELNEHIFALAAEESLPLIDLFSLFVNDDGFLRSELTSDGMHFADPGYEIWAGEILKVLDGSQR